jgi:hypothetical protein
MLKLVATILMLIAVIAIPIALAHGETLPNNFAGAGLGFQSMAVPQTSGWSEYCHRNPDVSLLGLTVPSYTCAATDYSANATSGRVDVDLVLVRKGIFAGGSKTGGGGAVNNNSFGVSYAVGGWGMIDLSRWIKLEGFKFAGSLTWQKDDLAVATKETTVPLVLRALAARTVVRLGFGKTW